MSINLQPRIEKLARLLKQKQLRLATAESCTGGGIAQALTGLAGSSEWFECAYISYSNASKQAMLGVDKETLAQQGAVSEAVVRQMAEGAVARSAASLAVSVSGVAGPGGGSAEKPVGYVWLAWATQDRDTQVACFYFLGDRKAVREQAVEAAIEGLIRLLQIGYF